jgi:hypothetical protein
MDLDKFVGQRPSNKSDLGYKKPSKTLNSLKLKRNKVKGRIRSNYINLHQIMCRYAAKNHHKAKQLV